VGGGGGGVGSVPTFYRKISLLHKTNAKKLQEYIHFDKSHPIIIFSFKDERS
jgi:hypothetical protein